MVRVVADTLALFLAATILVAQDSQGKEDKPAETQVQFHGTYEELKPLQKKLIDEWYAEYNRLTNNHSSPAEDNDLSLSTRAPSRR